MKVNVKTIIICLFLLFCMIIPASATYEVSNGSFIESIGFEQTITNYTVAGGSSHIPVVGLFFRKIEEYPQFNALKYNNNVYVSTFIRYNTSLNYSYQSVTLKDSITNQLVSSGIFGYHWSDADGRWYVYYFADSWDISGLTGPHQLIFDGIDLNKFTLTADYYEYCEDLKQDRDVAFIKYSSNTNPEYCGAITYPSPIENSYYTIEYTDAFFNHWYLYKDSPSSLYYKIYIAKVFDYSYASRIKITVTENGINTTVFDHYSNTDEFIDGLHPNNFPYYIDIWAKNNTFRESIKLDYSITPDYSLTVDKGNTLSTKLLPKELTEARLIGDVSNVKEVRWGWSESLSDNSNLFNWKYQYYRYNNTISSWERYYNRFHNINIENDLPTIVSENEVINREISFNWSDSSTYWNLNLPPNNFVQVTVYDNDNNQLAALIKHLYVGSSPTDAITTIYIYDVRTGTYLSDSKLYIYDESTSNYIINGEEISYKKKIELPYLDDYVIWATHTDFEQSYSKSLGVNFYGKYLNYTPWAYSNTDIQIWMNYIGIGMNRSVVLHIVNEEGLPIETAQCKFDSSQSHDTITSNNYGDCWYQAIDTVNYTYEVSKSSYNTVSGSFLANTTIYKRITLSAYTQPTTATITPTITPTPTPEEAPADLIGIIFWYLRQLGIELTNAKLLIAGMLILICIIIVGYYTKSGIAALSGGGVGFIISLALGLIPIWVFIAMIVVFGMLLAYRWNAQGG